MSKNKKNQKPQNKRQSPPVNRQKQSMSENHSESVLRVPSQDFKVTITMDSDWHIGSGAGRPGDIDRLILRDRNGFPYIPAKTLTGIWRDACELVALGLDNGDEKGIWHQWIDYLFGEQPALLETNLEKHPRPAAVSIRTASFSKEFKQAIETIQKQEAKSILKNALTFIKPGISIDRDSGCAKEEHLRFAEMARIGANLEATCELNFGKANEEQQKTAYALLLAGTKMVERIGGKRRRGSGKCRLAVQKDGINSWLDWLESQLEKPIESLKPPEFERDTEVNNCDETQANKKENWVKIKLTLTTESPVVIAARIVGNVVESLDYIPGTHLLPIVCKKLQKNLYRAIAQGDLIVTNATVKVGDDKGKPIPLAMFYEKVGGSWKEGKGIYNRLIDEEPANHKQLKGYRQDYIGSTPKGKLPLYKSSKDIISGVATHNTIKDEYQRPDKEVGGVYSYQNIASGTTLQAELRLRPELAEYLSNQRKDWWEALNGKEKIGQSKKDDYGWVSVQAEVNTSSDLDENKYNYTSTLTVWLLSDVLLRDDRLRPTTDIEDFRKALENHINVRIAARRED